MDDVLLEIVLQRLDAEPLPDEAAGLLLAALDSDAALAAQLSAHPADLPASPEQPQPAPTPAGAYLRALTVSGFRGIGPATTLQVAPGPGLTLVTGRNGSGKSSFAEALEVLLTGTLLRWAQAPAIVRDGWRSKHSDGATEIQAEFLVEGSGKAVVTRFWQPGADLANSAEWLQRTGEKRTSLDQLGWADALTEYRPFLSHTELEAFFGRPSELHDLLAAVLGLDDLTTASERLNAARKEREDALTKVKRQLEPLSARLRQLDDDRARACLTALTGRSWDLDAAKSAVVGTAAPTGGQLEMLRRLAQLGTPPADQVGRAVFALLQAATDLEDVAGTAAGQALALAGLLDAALHHHDAQGDGDCPVCGTSGVLTADWRASAQEQLLRLRAEAAAAQAAASQAKGSADQAFALLLPKPTILSEPEVAGLDLKSAAQAWDQWTTRPAGADLATPAGLRAMADHLERTAGQMESAVSDLAGEAREELMRRDDRWAPLAADVASWCADAESASTAAGPVAAIKKARTWLISAAAELRAARLTPLADQARQIWAMLRQESSVDLGAFRLAGTATRRSLELDVSIDGSPGAALGVMSQGEINALALSIFLPRATMPQSPFRFLIIDDPVQAMDPAKVDGLARVLHRVAADRQVIVFTHDNRLAAALRDLDIPANFLEVTRRPQSEVQVRACLDPVEQALMDAGAVSADPKVPDEVAKRVIPGLCRTAVEAALTQAVWRQQLRAGRNRDEIDSSLADAGSSLTNLAALALFGDAGQGSKVLPRLDGLGRTFADTFKALNRGSHVPHEGDLGRLVSDSRKLAAKISEILA
jgi:energy-coupling factor transporter ATP-binding protein EcfA2